MSRYSTLLAALLLTGVIGCSESKLQKEVTEDSTWETSTGAEERKAANRAPVADPESTPRISSGSISREDLLSVLDRGLGRFLQNVETEAAFHKGAFVGFRIVSLFPGEPSFASLDLRPGDTVTAVNAKPIERPEQAAAVWEDLRTASRLVVDYRREGESHALRFAIVDAP
jgi:type II secretory pathway component PulC